MAEIDPELEVQTNPLGAEPELVRQVADLEAPETAVPEVPAGRRAAATFIFLTVTLDMLAMGMISPVLPKLIEDFLHGNASRTATMIGLFGTLFAGIQFVFSPVLGSLSDRYGRRPVVLLSNFGLGLDYVVMALAPTLNWLFVGRIVSGLTASSVPTAMAYMTDVTPHEKRAAAFGMLGAAFGMGFVLGPALGGLLGQVNPRLPFWAAGGLSLINGMYGLFVLPESLQKENRTPFSWKRANPVGSIKLLGRNKVLVGMASVLVLGYLAQQSLMNVYMLYVYTRYGWTVRTGGLSLGLVGLCSGLYGALLVKRVVAKLGERRTMSVGLVGGAVGWCMMALSKTGGLVWFSIPVLNMMSLVWPSAQSVMSREVGAGGAGTAAGCGEQPARDRGGWWGPGLFTLIYSRTLGFLPGMAFFVAAGILLVSLLVGELVRPATPARS